MVASINQTVHEGDEVKRGDEVGYFAFGGSTIVVVFPPNTVVFDPDLVENSKHAVGRALSDLIILSLTCVSTVRRRSKLSFASEHASAGLSNPRPRICIFFSSFFSFPTRSFAFPL